MSKIVILVEVGIYTYITANIMYPVRELYLGD